MLLIGKFRSLIYSAISERCVLTPVFCWFTHVWFSPSPFLINYYSSAVFSFLWIQQQIQWMNLFLSFPNSGTFYVTLLLKMFCVPSEQDSFHVHMDPYVGLFGVLWTSQHSHWYLLLILSLSLLVCSVTSPCLQGWMFCPLLDPHYRWNLSQSFRLDMSFISSTSVFFFSISLCWIDLLCIPPPFLLHSAICVLDGLFSSFISLNILIITLRFHLTLSRCHYCRLVSFGGVILTCLCFPYYCVSIFASVFILLIGILKK